MPFINIGLSEAFSSELCYCECPVFKTLSRVWVLLNMRMSSVASFQAIKEANYSVLLTEYIPNFLFCVPHYFIC